MYRLLQIIILLLSGMLAPFEQKSDGQQIIEKLAAFSWSHPQEKVYIHTDKHFYMPGEDVWFKAYLMIGPYQVPDTISGVLYVELIDEDGFLFDNTIIRMRNGLGWGDFRLPETLAPGNLVLKAYSRYMQNYDPAFHFRKNIKILPHTPEMHSEVNRSGPVNAINSDEAQGNEILMRFFPEGGDLVTGLQSLVAFKATDINGHGKRVQGRIIDLNNGDITTFESRKFGMGTFSLKPETGQQYKAIVSAGGNEYEFMVPAALEKGYVMHINLKNDNVYIWVRNNLGIKMDGTFLIGQFRGFPFIHVRAEKNKDFLYSVINIRDMPSGIIQFTFFDADGVPQCERLIYQENEGNYVATVVETDKTDYRKREEIHFDIHCEDESGNYPLTNMSLSITNTALIRDDVNDSNIRSYFSLESDLVGSVENPGYYFNPSNQDRFELLDILMLTHGWRRFVWQDILNDRFPEMNYTAEYGFNFEGKVFENYNMTRPGKGTVRMFLYEDQFYYNESETDENGFFQFLGVNFYDTTHVVMQAWETPDQDNGRKKRKSLESGKKLAIQLDQKSPAEINPDLWPLQFERGHQEVEDYFDLNQMIMKLDSAYDERTVLLDEIVVEDRKINAEDPFSRPGKLHSNFTRRIVMDSLQVAEQSLLFFDLVRKYYPNISVRGAPPEVQVLIRGNRSLMGDGQALLLLDGLSVSSDYLYYFPVTEIAYFDVLSSAQASIYGQGSMNGAIAVYTRNEPAAYEQESRDWVVNFRRPGYRRAREFYTPDYGIPEEKHLKPDYRKVLYWNPSLTTDEMGNISFSFYTSDEAAEYRVEIEGMTYEGEPVMQEYFFKVR